MSTELPSKLIEKDCFECRLMGSLGCAAIGAFVFYNSSASYYSKRPYMRLGIRTLAGAFIYAALARWFYLPPFSSLKGSQPVMK